MSMKSAIKEHSMNIQSHRLGRAVVIFATGACLAACSSKPRESSASESGGTDYYGSSGAEASTDSTYPYGTDYEGNPGMGGAGTILLDTVYQSDTSWNRSDSAQPGTEGNPGTGLPGTQGRGGSGMDSLRGPDSMNRDSGLGLPDDAYPGTGAPGTGTGAPGSIPEAGSGQGGTRDSMDLDSINDSLGVLDWYERG
jgi:hypothetical protein